MSQAPEWRPTEEPNRRGRGRRKGVRGGDWRDASSQQQPVADGAWEPPLCFGLKNDWVGVVIGESKRMGVRGQGRERRMGGARGGA